MNQSCQLSEEGYEGGDDEGDGHNQNENGKNLPLEATFSKEKSASKLSENPQAKNISSTCVDGVKSKDHLMLSDRKVIQTVPSRPESKFT